MILNVSPLAPGTAFTFGLSGFAATAYVVSGFGVSGFGLSGYGVGHTRTLLNDAPLAPWHFDSQLLCFARVRRHAIVFVAAHAPVRHKSLMTVQDLGVSLELIKKYACSYSIGPTPRCRLKMCGCAYGTCVTHTHTHTCVCVCVCVCVHRIYMHACIYMSIQVPHRNRCV